MTIAALPCTCQYGSTAPCPAHGAYGRDEIATLTAQRDAARDEVARLRDALERVGRNDKTEYDYPNTADLRAKEQGRKPRRIAANHDGALPSSGRWLTPAEIASEALRLHRIADATSRAADR